VYDTQIRRIPKHTANAKLTFTLGDSLLAITCEGSALQGTNHGSFAGRLNRFQCTHD
jgi:hypothetical protein